MTNLLKTALVLGVVMAMVACAGAPAQAPQPPELPAPAVAAAQPTPPDAESSPAESQPPLPPEPSAPPRQPEPPPSPTPTPTSRQPASMEPTAIPVTFPVTVTSADGREVVFEEPPERIVAFDSAVVEILFAIGAGDRIAATHAFVSYPPETAEIPRVGDAFNMDIEAVVDLEPDLVYVFFPTFVEDLERAGLKALYIPTLSQNFRKVADNIRLWGQIVGSPNEAERVAGDFEDRVEAIEDVMEPFGSGLSVFQDVGGFWAPGRGTLVQEVFDLLKLENIASDIEGYAQISPEVIVEKDPDVIITGSVESIEGEPALSNVRAVRNGAIYVPPTDSLSIAGPRFVEGIEDLARWVYPGLFR